MPAEFRNPDGTLSQGYFCMRCGKATAMMGHMGEECAPNPELVKALIECNQPGWVRKTSRQSVATPVEKQGSNLKVYLKHDYLDIYIKIEKDLKTGLTSQKNAATDLQSAPAWSPIIRDLWEAGFDTRPWSCKFEFTE